jgi:hypothetical protein
MGNCKSKSKSHVVGPSYPDDSKGVFRYDKDSRKILFVGEDAEDTEITGVGSSQSYVSTSTKSADPSGLHAEPVERSLLGEIAEFLEDDGDDSTVNTMSTRGRSSPMLYIPKPERTNQHETVLTASSSKTRGFDDSKLGIIKLTNDPYSIITKLSDGTDNSDETADTSILNGLNHLKSGDSQMQQEFFHRQDPDPEDWDGDYISADSCKETPKSPNLEESAIHFDALIQKVSSIEESNSSADDLQRNLEETSMMKNGEGYVGKSKSQLDSSANSNDKDDCQELLETMTNGEKSHTSLDDLDCNLQNILSVKSEDMDEFYDEGYIPLTKTNSSDSSDCKSSSASLDTRIQQQTDESCLTDPKDQKHNPSTIAAKPTSSNPDKEVDSIDILQGSSTDKLAAVSDDVNDRFEHDDNGTNSAEYVEKETTGTGSHEIGSASKGHQEKQSFGEESLSMSASDFKTDIAREIVTSDLGSNIITKSIEKRQCEDEKSLSGSEERQFSPSETEIDHELDVTTESKAECSRRSPNYKVDDPRFSGNDISFSDFSTNQDLVSENENGLSFDEEDDTDLSRDDSLNKDEIDSTSNNENDSYLLNAANDECKEPSRTRKEDGNDFSKCYKLSKECKTSANDVDCDSQAVMDDLSCLLDENMGSSGESGIRSPLMSPETVLNDNKSNDKEPGMSTELKIGEKRCSLIPRVPQYSPIKCRSPYTGNRKSAIQPPSPARSFPRTPLDTVGLVSDHTTSNTFDRQTPRDQSTKLTEAMLSSGSSSSRGDLSVTPQSLPWDEKEGSRNIRSQRNSFPGSATSSVSTPKSSRKSASLCASKWDPYVHAEKKGCERCLTLCSSEEREKFLEFGRHQRVTKTSGGCTKDCSLYAGERFYDSDAIVLCRICFHAVHRRSNIKTKDPTVRTLTSEYN